VAYLLHWDSPEFGCFARQDGLLSKSLSRGEVTSALSSASTVNLTVYATHEVVVPEGPGQMPTHALLLRLRSDCPCLANWGIQGSRSWGSTVLCQGQAYFTPQSRWIKRCQGQLDYRLAALGHLSRPKASTGTFYWHPGSVINQLVAPCPTTQQSSYL
jgi:hypothetical protein